jgi:hypothetical protein
MSESTVRIRGHSTGGAVRRTRRSSNLLRIMVPEEGVEPSRPEGHGILSPILTSGKIREKSNDPRIH